MMKNLLFIVLIFSCNSSNGQWYGFGKEVQQNWSSDIILSNTKLFPDSTVFVTSSSNGELIPVFNHSTGQVFDPTSEFFEFSSGEPVPDSEPYFVDSIGFWYTYQRAQEEPDTLVIQFFREENLELIEQPWPNWDGMETASRARMTYDLQILRSPDPYIEVTRIMDDEDITLPPISKFMTIPIEEYIPPGEVVAATVTYYPGNPYNSGDTLEFDEEPHNQILQFTMRHFSDYDQVFETNDYNHGFMAHTCVRYGTCESWAEQYISGNAWGGENGRIFHSDIRFHLSPAIGSDEDLKNGRFELYPNPVADRLTMEIGSSLHSPLLIFIHDLHGREMRVEGVSGLEQGKQAIDVSLFPKGIYIVTVIHQDKIFTSKFMKY